MMVSMFSVFDPVSFFGMSLNWLVFFFYIGMIPFQLELVKGGEGMMLKKVELVLLNLFKDVSFPRSVGISEVSVIVFVGLSVLNVLGLFPFVFSVTSHLVVSFSLGMVMWFSFFFMGWMSSMSEMSSHLVPEGSPIGLAPFMVFVEMVSHLIRPITLSVRLVANMVAGHLILGLISSLSLISWNGMVISVFFQSVMLVMEWAVMFIQAFVFGILLLLYILDYS